MLLISKNKWYDWAWLILPNWRYYLVNHDKKWKKTYNGSYWKPNRIKIWKINGYKYKFYVWRH